MFDSATIIITPVAYFISIYVCAGARQLDTVPATIEVLPEICRAVAKKVEVLLYHDLLEFLLCKCMYVCKCVCRSTWMAVLFVELTCSR